jgi:putative transposase
LTAEFQASERHACELMEIARTTHRYSSCRDDSWLREQLLRLAREKPRFGYRRIHLLLGREGVVVNHKRVQRVYRELGLSVKRTKRKRLIRVVRPRPLLSAPNQEWAADFVSDVTAGGQRLRVLCVIDSFTRECLALEVDTSLPSRRVTRVLELVIQHRGVPVAIRCDNGPEITSRHFLAWGVERKIDIVHIQPGKPTQNAHVESFNGRLREECLNVSWFWNLFDARRKIACWRDEYNQQRPHSSLNYFTPEEFRRQFASPSTVTDTTEIGPASRQPCGRASLGLDPGPIPP